MNELSTKTPEIEGGPSTSGTIDIVMPELLPGMTEGRIMRWHLTEGESVREGDILADIATAAATLELEAKSSGRLARILHRAGEAAIAVSTPIAKLLAEPELPAGADLPGPALGFAAMPAAGMTDGPDRETVPTQACVGDTQLLSYREALRDALREEMGRDESIFLIGSGVAQNSGAAEVTQGLLDVFGARRVAETPPLDSAVMGLAIGAAMAGLRPVVTLERFEAAGEAFDQLLTAAARAGLRAGRGKGLPLVLRGPDGWSPGMGPAMSLSLAAILSHIPGLTVLAPATPADAKGLLKAALRAPGPVIVLEHELLYPMTEPVPANAGWIVPIGKAALAREGRDLTIVTYGQSRAVVMEAARELALEGIEAEVIDLRTLKPLDMAAVVASVRKTGRLLTVEEGWPQGSIGSEVCACLAATALGALRAPPVRLTGADCAVPFSEALERAALPDARRVAEAARALRENRI